MRFRELKYETKTDTGLDRVAHELNESRARLVIRENESRIRARLVTRELPECDFFVTEALKNDQNCQNFRPRRIEKELKLFKLLPAAHSGRDS